MTQGLGPFQSLSVPYIFLLFPSNFPSPRLPACVPPLPTPPRSRSWSCHRGVRFHAPAQMNGRPESAKQTSRWRRMERMRMRSDCIWADACRLLLQTVLQLTRSSSTPLQRSRLALVPPSCTIYIAPASPVSPSERTVPTNFFMNRVYISCRTDQWSLLS